MTPVDRIASIFRRITAVPAVAGLAVVAMVALALPATAQSTDGDRAVAPAPDGAPELVRGGKKQTRTGRRIRVYVFGDSLGDGMAYGLRIAFKGDKAVKVVRRSRGSTGFVRQDFYNWNAALKDILDKEEMDIAVVMIGANDRQRMRKSDGRHKFGTPEFIEIYTKRVDEFMKSFTGRGIAVYWIGMPIMRGPKHSAAMQVLNKIYEERAKANNITYVPTWEEFLGENGKYKKRGPDITGRIRNIRAGDGVHFTRRGYRKMAALIERPIRDFLVAGPVVKGERMIAAPNLNADGVAEEGQETSTAAVDPFANAYTEAQDIASGRSASGGDASANAAAQSGVGQIRFPEQSAAHTVLTLGGRVAPKPGRGDDFSWQQ